jgi:branched-chain amino acid transport system substrate-binding protein
MDKKFKIFFCIILIIVIAIFVFVGVRGYKREVDFTGDTIKIGVSLPITYEAGGFWAEGATGGLKLAQKEINERGGILGKQIELIIEDDGCEEKGKGIEVWNKLINIDKVLAILGPVCPEIAIETLPLAQASKIPVIMGGDSVPQLARHGNYIFNSYPSDVLNAKFIADYIFTELNKKKVAVFSQKTLKEGGVIEGDLIFESLKNFFIERVNRFKNIGMEIVFDDYVLTGADNKIIESKIGEIEESGAEVIYFSLSCDSTGHKAADIIRKSELDVVVIGAEFLSLFPEFEGALYSVPMINNPQEFQDRVSEIHKGSINFLSPIYYDLLYILSQAIERAGELDRELIRDELTKTSYRGIAFPIVEFDEDGDLKEAEFEVMIIKEGGSEVYSIEE